MWHLILSQVADPVTSFASIAKDFGVPTAMVVFFTWWSYSRESLLNKRIDAHDEFIRTTMLKSVNDAASAMSGMTAAIKEFFGDKK